MDLDLSVLTKRQREVYLARQKGETYIKIAESIGCCYNNARNHYVAAVRRLREQEVYNSLKTKNSVPVTLTLTLGELKVARLSLEWQKADLLKKRMRRKPENRTPSYEYDTTVLLLDKICKAIEKNDKVC